MTPQDCRAERIRLGLDVHDLARRAGLVERTVLRFEAGLARPRPVTLVALRKAFRTLAAERAASRPFRVTSSALASKRPG